MMVSQAPRWFRKGGFTLVELILAIFLGSGLLVGVLSFYGQSARLRDELQSDVETLSRIRLLFETLARELPSTISTPGDSSPEAARLSGLRGSEDWIEFVIPALAGAELEALRDADQIRSHARLVRYGPVQKTSPLDGTSLDRAAPSPSTLDATLDADVDTPDTNPVGDELTSAVGGVERDERELFGSRLSPTPLRVPILDPGEGRIRFRYFANGRWQGTWHGPGLPRGIELSLSIDSTTGVDAAQVTNDTQLSDTTSRASVPPADTTGADSATPSATSSASSSATTPSVPTLFRRVVYLPAARRDVAVASPALVPEEEEAR